MAYFFLIHTKVSCVEYFLEFNADIQSYLRFGNSFNPLSACFWRFRCVAPVSDSDFYDQVKELLNPSESDDFTAMLWGRQASQKEDWIRETALMPLR
jgi:hypothetical protein